MSETISPSFTFAKAGVYYFSRRIPSELICHYSSPRIAFSLRTRSARVAEARARKAADQLDEYWFHLRSQDRQLPGKHMLRITKAVHKGVQGAETQLSDASVLLSEAVSIYLHQKGRDRPVTFHRAAERACGYVIDECGDKHLEVYTKADANAFRDALIRRGLAGSSITRVFGTVRAVTNFAASEQGLTLLNPFAGVYYDREAGVFDRLSMPSDALASVQKVCRNMDDDMRWLVSMVSDTGMRLAEVAGLLKDDICEDENGYLYVSVRPHPWRRLKTKGSERVVPLEGEALWAARQVLLLDDP
ncbi:MAG: integrase, partial [Paracoccaceae bacterium]